MAIDPWAMIEKGGRPALALLEFCVISVQLEIVVAWLITDFRNRPTAQRAFALYDAFLDPRAPARIRAQTALPPRDLKLLQQIERLRSQVEERALADAAAPPFLPPRTLFDTLHAALTDPQFEPIRNLAGSYDAKRDPAENLPGGRMSPGQRAFVENTWRPRVRPALVRAGFPRVATHGG
jgi:hypothetical protein